MTFFKIVQHFVLTVIEGKDTLHLIFRHFYSVKAEVSCMNAVHYFRTVVFAASISLACHAQTAVTTSGGNAGSVPKFDGSSTLTNSIIKEDGNGHVGIGTTTPSTQLEVNGSILLTSSSGGMMIFSDGSAQTTAWPGQAAISSGNPWPTFITWPATGQGSFTLTPSGTMVNKTYVVVSGDSHNLKIATLPATNDGTYDHLHFSVVLNNTWQSHQNSLLDVLMSNRSGFQYQYTMRGKGPAANAKLTAYRATSGDIDIYLSFPGTYPYSSGSYTVLENIQSNVYAEPTDFASPSGTLIFDSSSPLYPPSTFESFDGKLGIRTAAPGAELDIAGNIQLSGSGAHIIFPDGQTQSVPWNGTTCGGDYAESVDVAGGRATYEPGDLLVIDEEHPDRFLKTIEPYSRLVAGVYSIKPGLTGRRQTTPKSEQEIPMAVVGIVPAKVSAENGAIRPGDLLVSASTPGYAMKGTDPARLIGAVIGKAMGRLNSGTGTIEVLVSLQ